jgi:hypothetical protein
MALYGRPALDTTPVDPRSVQVPASKFEDRATLMAEFWTPKVLTE